MTQGIQYAGEFDVLELTLYSSSGVVVDLSKSAMEVNLFEDVFKNSMSGSILTYDTENLIMNMPVIGQEFVTLRLKTPTLQDNPRESIDFTDHAFCAYKIGLRQDLSKGSQIFEIHLTSPEMLRNSRLRVSKSYTGTASETVEKILRDSLYINTKKDLFIEKTAGIRKVVAPNIHPYDLIRNLTTEAISAVNGSPHFLFYENARGIYFRSIQSIYALGTMGDYHDGNAGDFLNTETVGTKSVLEDSKRVIKFAVGNNNDMLANITGGMLGSKIITHDIYNKNYETKEYKYFENFKTHDRIDKNPIYNNTLIDDNDNTVGDFPDARIHLHPTSTTTDSLDAQHYETETSTYPYTSNRIKDSLLQRQARFMELNKAISITLQVIGYTTMSAGQMIQFYKQIKGNVHGGEKIDKFYSGKYLITKLRHHFSFAPEKKYEIMMTCAKEGLPEELPRYSKSKEPVGKTGSYHAVGY